MAYRRYTERDIILNDDEQYRRQFYKGKDLENLSHYETPELVYPTPEEIEDLDQKPTDAHFKIGDIISVPTPIERVLRIIKV